MRLKEFFHLPCMLNLGIFVEHEKFLVPLKQMYQPHHLEQK